MSQQNKPVKKSSLASKAEGSKKATTEVQPSAKELMTQLKSIREELAKEREQRNFFQLERV